MAQRRSLFQSVRSRVIVGGSIWVILLTLLGSYATVLTIDEALRLGDVHTYQKQVYVPAEKLVTALQEERLISVEFIGGGGGTVRDQLEEQRRETDKALQAFQRSIKSSDVRDEPALKSKVDAALADLAEMKRHRPAIANDDVERGKTITVFNNTINSLFRIYDKLPSATEPHVGSLYRSVVALQRAREVLAREVSQLAGALAAGRLSESEHQAFDRTVGARRLLLEQFASGLDGSQRKQWAELVAAAPFTTFQELENEVTDFDSETVPLPVSATAWKRAGKDIASALQTFEASLAGEVSKISDEESGALMLRAILIIVVGALIVLLLMAVWLTVAPRYITKQLFALKDGALELAEKRLPDLMDKLRRGERVDLQTAAPPLQFGPDEFGQVGQAFNEAQRAAIRAAIEQAELRSGIRDVFVNLARRSQGLVHRQLSLLDEMERRTSDPDELERLFAIDHLATRMRRHAEDLIILSGSPPGRQWRKPVPMVDVVRSAVGEVEGYSRVTVLPIADASLSGRVVADVIHLLAELVENATTFSPPQTKVRVGGDLVPNGFVVEIEDSGLGMSREDLERYNRRLMSPPEFNPTDSAQLGLFVVARLAQRHDIRVHLRDSPYGGTTAIVLIPGNLIEGVPDQKPAIEAGPSAAAPRTERPSPTRAAAARSGDLTSGQRPTPMPAYRAAEHPPAIDGTVNGTVDATVNAAVDAAVDATVVERSTTDADSSKYDTLSLSTVSAGPQATDPTRDNPPPLEARQVSPGGAYTTTNVDASGEPQVYESTTSNPSAPTAPPSVSGPTGDPGGDAADTSESRDSSPPAPERPFDPNAAPATAAGLPRRIRQASLANELRETTRPTAPSPPARRSPEEIRQMMTTFQQGSLRGRREALPADDGPPAAPSRPSPRPSASSQNEDK